MNNDELAPRGASVGIAAPVDVRAIAEHARELADAALSPRTARVYETYWKQFETFCASIGAPSLPAPQAAVIAFLAMLSKSGKKTSTISVAFAALRRAHDAVGHRDALNSRDIRDVMKGVRRRAGKESTPKKELRLDYLRVMIAKGPTGPRGVRNTALLLFGWWTAMRRSEIVATNIEHVSFSDEGMTVRILRSKTNQTGREELVAVPYASDHRVCPVRAVQRWIRAMGSPMSGPLFVGVRSGKRLTAQRVWILVREHAKRAGVDPNLFGAHSLRSGFATEAAKAKKRPDAIRDHLRHASIEMTMRYVRREGVWDENAATGLA